jgi:hypothetical protein
MSSNASLGAYGIMYVVQNKKIQVIALLLKNGIVVPDNSSDVQIGLLVTNLLKVSKSFYQDFSALLLTQDVVDGMSSNMSGSYANVGGEGVGYTFGKSGSGFNDPVLGFDPTKFTTPTKTTKTTKTSTSGSGWLNTGLGLLQTGFEGYLQLDDNKTKRLLADASVKVSNDEVIKKEDAPPPKGLSTGAIIGLSLLGVTVIGLVVYLVAKKK